MSKLVSDTLTNMFAGKAPVMFVQHSDHNGGGVIWSGPGAAALDGAVRASWEAHVFQPGDRVTVDPALDAVSRAAFAPLLRRAWRAGPRGLVVKNTIIATSLKPAGNHFEVTCEIRDCEGRWPHDRLVDARPIDRVCGALLTRGVSTWLIPLIEGSDMQRDHRLDPVLLKPRLERRARFALGADRIRDVAPMLGEFLVARGTGETGALYAVLWTSPLGPDEYAAGRAMLTEIRSERHASAAGPVAFHIPHRLPWVR